MRIDGDAVTVLSSDMSLWSARVYDTDEHRRVEMIVDEIWQHDPSIQLPPFSVQVTYDLELTPIAELEGTAGYQFFVDAPPGWRYVVRVHRHRQRRPRDGLTTCSPSGS